MKTWSLKLTAATSSILLGLMVARCVPVKSKSSESSIPTSNRPATEADLSVHIVKVDPANKDKYFLEVGSKKEVEKFSGVNAKITAVTIFETSEDSSTNMRYPLKLSSKTASDKTRQLFEGSISIELNPEMKYTVVASDKDGKDIYKAPRTLYFKKKQKSGDSVAKEIKWESVEKILKQSCAGADCHIQGGGENAFHMERDGFDLVDEKDFKANKAKIQDSLEKDRMPRDSTESTSLSAQDEKLIIDYISQLN